MASHEDDRIAYLAGEEAASLSASERAELEDLRGHLSAKATWVEPDADLENRIVAAVTSEAGAERATRRAARSPFAARLGLRRPALALGALGALAAAVLALAIVLSSGGGSPSARFAMAVSGTALAPNAHGSATLTKTASGWRIELSASGLPRLAGGRYYQAWLKNPAGVLVPVGTFNDARKVTLWAGVPPTAFPALTVTRQRADGNPASSGERVLLGALSATH
jgi:hypothetical protein